VTATISNLAGRPVRQLVGNRAVPAGGQSLLWDGASSAGTRAPNGLYLVTLTARLADGSQAQGLVTVNLR
jgi:flagellar hook assembly protein FlgD